MALRRTLNLLAAATIGLGTAGAANAVLVTAWDWVVTTEWTSATFSGGGGTTEGPPPATQTVSWGATGGDHHVTGLAPAASRSGIDITPLGPVSSPPQAITNGGFVDTHTFTHFNNTILASFAALTNATVETTLTLTPAVPPGPGLPAFSTTFDVEFIETLNSASCGFPSTTVCDDIFVITLPEDLTTDFVFDGITYTVEIGGSIVPLPAASCAAAGATAPCFGLQTLEGATTEAPFAFQITAAVPEPGVLALIGLGLAGLGFAGRRRAR